MPSKADTPAYLKLCRRLDRVEELLPSPADWQADGSCPPIDWVAIHEVLEDATHVAFLACSADDQEALSNR